MVDAGKAGNICEELGVWKEACMLYMDKRNKHRDLSRVFRIILEHPHETRGIPDNLIRRIGEYELAVTFSKGMSAHVRERVRD